MDTYEVDFNAEPKSALVSLHARVLDCGSAKPVLGDENSLLAAKQLHYDFDQLKVRTDDAIAMLIRAEQLDVWTREFLAAHPDGTVLHLGCGLDRRIDRIDPPAGSTWYDVDLPEVIGLYGRLFAQRPGQHLVGTSVTEPGWLEEIPATGPVLVVAEGLTMLLTEEQVRTLVDRVIAHFGTGEFVFDVYNQLAIRSMARHPTIQASGVTLRWGIDDAREVAAWSPALTFDREWFIVGSPHVRAMPFTSIVITRFMHLFPGLRRLSRLVRLRFSA